MSNRRTPGASGPSKPLSIRLPADVIQAGNDALDQMDDILDPPKPLSALSVRLHDGALFCSLEDAADRDLSGREVVSFLRLTDAEILSVRANMDDALADVAANVIGRLPMKVRA